MKYRIYLYIFIPFFTVACATAPYTNRNQLILTSETEEIQLGQQAWQETLSSSTLSKNSQYNAALKRVATRLAKAADKENYSWEFVVIESDTANAFCLPGGKVAIYSGLFKVLDNDAELATVVGHEIAHAVARHGGERISQSLLQQAGGSALAIVLKQVNVSPDWAQIYGIATNVGVMLPYSRQQEYEADRIGMIIMAKAGYTPQAAVNFWQKYAKMNEFNMLQEFFTTHPMGSKRLEEIKGLLPYTNKYYLKSSSKQGFGKQYKK